MMKKSIIAMAMALALTVSCFTGCAQSDPPAPVPETEAPDAVTALADGGILVLSVNPKIAVEYGNDGKVTGVTARNEDALAIIASCTGLIGQETRVAVAQLVKAIGEAGYFLEDIDGEKRQITLEIEAGSKLPSDTFLDDVIAEIRSCVAENTWATPLAVRGESDYGITDYVDTDYGPNNDGITDYDDTDYGPNNDGITDYDDTDYGPNNDGITDYDDTDYGPNNDSITDYDDTDYGPNNDGITDYDDTDYGPEGDGVTDYRDTDYGDPITDYGLTDYDD